MSSLDLLLHGASLAALPSGALHWPSESVLVVSDLHFGKAIRAARTGGAALPPYEARDTLARLAADLDATGARRVICLGDSFDAAGLERHLPDADLRQLRSLQDGRDWVWIRGNHDPVPPDLDGDQLETLGIGALTFRHIADPAEVAEVSGHYHPKARLRLRGRTLSRPCFLLDRDRLILPAYGTYTGGLRSHDPVLSGLMRADALAILTGSKAMAIPMPR